MLQSHLGTNSWSKGGVGLQIGGLCKETFSFKYDLKSHFHEVHHRCCDFQCPDLAAHLEVRAWRTPKLLAHA